MLAKNHKCGHIFLAQWKHPHLWNPLLRRLPRRLPGRLPRRGLPRRLPRRLPSRKRLGENIIWLYCILSKSLAGPFSMEEGWFVYSMHPEEYISSTKKLQMNCLCVCSLRHACTEQLCTWPCSLTKNIWCRPLCLASDKKSIEQLRPTTPQKISTLELLVFYCFHILLVYPHAL